MYAHTCLQVMKKTELYEGSVIRVIRRLEELLRQLASSASGIGNMELKTKFEATADRMRRDIVFCGR
jgi:ATP-dependent RNA helicase DOB1